MIPPTAKIAKRYWRFLANDAAQNRMLDLGDHGARDMQADYNTSSIMNWRLARKKAAANRLLKRYGGNRG
jgi:hypothetical protein